MVELAEDDIELDFAAALIWLLDDEDSEVRASAVEGLWENTSATLLHRLLQAAAIRSGAGGACGGRNLAQPLRLPGRAG